MTTAASVAIETVDLFAFPRPAAILDASGRGAVPSRASRRAEADDFGSGKVSPARLAR
jgi:hypothetical protein